VAGAFDAIAQRAEEILGGAGDAVARAADELPAFARLLRGEPRLRLALTDITVTGQVKRELLRSLLENRIDAVTLEVISLLADHSLSPDELTRAADDMAVRGLLAGAEASGALEDVEDQLFRFARVIDGSVELRSALTDPTLPEEVPRKVIDDLLSDRVRPETLELVRFALETRGTRDPSDVLTWLVDAAAARRGRVVVEARTAVPIDVQRRARLIEALTRVVGRPVKLEVVVDSTVRGGVVARVGDELIDGSVRRMLERALEELTG
jgi:F-type H+-transporting ATPase subunit delta